MDMSCRLLGGYHELHAIRLRERRDWMTREARLTSGIILITVPTIQYGADMFLLTSLMNKGSGFMDNALCLAAP